MNVVGSDWIQQVIQWTGPKRGDVDPMAPDVLLVPVPGDRWPYGPPVRHQDICLLKSGGLFCDCAASAADDSEWGML